MKDIDAKIKVKGFKKYNPHSWFFTYTQSLEGYNKDYEKAIREGIVYEYSRGQTSSLKEFYDIDHWGYRRMKRELQDEIYSEMDLARKRLMAVLYCYFHFLGYRPDDAYIKEAARKAARANKFNAIPLPKLQQLYKIFGDKYKNKSTEWSNNELNRIAEEVANGND